MQLITMPACYRRFSTDALTAYLSKEYNVAEPGKTALLCFSILPARAQNLLDPSDICADIFQP